MNGSYRRFAELWFSNYMLLFWYVNVYVRFGSGPPLVPRGLMWIAWDRSIIGFPRTRLKLWNFFFFFIIDMMSTRLATDSSLRLYWFSPYLLNNCTSYNQIELLRESLPARHWHSILLHQIAVPSRVANRLYQLKDLYDRRFGLLLKSQYTNHSVN